MVLAEAASLEISSYGINKGVGLEKLCEHLGISLGETIVEGDSDNDREVLKRAGLAVQLKHFYLHYDNGAGEFVYAEEKVSVTEREISLCGYFVLGMHSQESASAKLFVEFVALMLRNKIYTCLSDEMERLEKKVDYMSVPVAIRELEKIEMVRQTDNMYRLDHAVFRRRKHRCVVFQTKPL